MTKETSSFEAKHSICVGGLICSLLYIIFSLLLFSVGESQVMIGMNLTALPYRMLYIVLFIQCNLFLSTSLEPLVSPCHKNKSFLFHTESSYN